MGSREMIPILGTCLYIYGFLFFFKDRRTGPNGTHIHHTLLYAKMFYKQFLPKKLQLQN